jgi:DNA-binding NarL/FixJ family response regulator
MLGLARADAVRQCMASDSAGAAQALAAAIATHRATSYPLDVARSLLALGQLLRRARRKAAAREAVVEAIEQFRLIQAAPWQAKAQRELDRLTHGTRPPTTVTTLSDQEWQIVDLVRAGASNREISRTVHLSVKAVEAILSRIYRRLGVRNRSEMLLALNDR